MSSSSLLSSMWEDQDSLLRVWLTRIVVSLALAFAWQWMTSASPSQQDDEQQQQQQFVGGTKRLDEQDERPKSRLLKMSFNKPKEEEAPILTFDEMEQEDVLDDKVPTDEMQEEEPAEQIMDEGDASETVQEEEPKSDKDDAPKEEEQEEVSETTPTTTTNSTTARQRRTARSITTAAATPPTPPPIKAKTSSHPGLDGFHHWYNIEASLYRIYTVGDKNGKEIPPPFIPKSERGHVQVKLEIQNDLYQDLEVFWVNYKGAEILKGRIKGNGGRFYQMTWIGHPFVFRFKETGALVLHYIPYRIIPTTLEVPTVDPDDDMVGRHVWTFKRHVNNHNDDDSVCWIDDPVLPMKMATVGDAAAWTFQHMTRCNYGGADTLLKYLTNILRHPAETKYRQIRIAHKRFQQDVWNTAARGLLLTAGFIEQGAYAELGSSNEPLPKGRIQELSTLVFYLEKWKQQQEQTATTSAANQQHQPQGADGSGRAGFGHAGGINNIDYSHRDY